MRATPAATVRDAIGDVADQSEPRRSPPGRRANDLAGRVFGQLTVLARAGSTKQTPRRPLWRCLCRCGREQVVLGASLVSGRTRSCGCLRAAMARSALVMARAELMTRRKRASGTKRAAVATGPAGTKGKAAGRARGSRVRKVAVRRRVRSA
jgi:hypothetical protein